VRFTLDNSVVLMTQLRAMLRASRDTGNLHLMFPMIGTVEQVEAFTAIVDSACEQLVEEGCEVKRPRVGIMVEVPAAIAILPFLGNRIDFVSIGSNDLSQYLLAVDRNNSRVADLFDHLHPAVLEAVGETVRRAGEAGLPVSVCGEMAADPCAAVLLLGMGIEMLSMAAYSIPRIKWLIRTVSRHEAKEQLEFAKQCAHPAETRARLREFLIARGLGKLLDPVGPEEG
jgi:phosphotransferase system enzyme I (PtsI)/phosphotransferase system enzyme I (PtsP)